MSQKVILDVDTGGDDGVAILLAGYHPAVELAAVTCVVGNAPLEIVLRNTLTVMEQGDLGEVPVYAGMARHLHSQTYSRQPDQARRLNLPDPAIMAAPGHAVDFLINYYLSDVGPETILVPLAPLTNIAMALLQAPELASRIPRLVLMGGAYIAGNATPAAEFNIYADPEAARVVFNAGIPLTMVGLEVTRQALLSHTDANRILAADSAGAKVAGALIHEEVEWFARYRDADAGQVYDACAVAAVIAPDILQTRPAHCDIELRGELTRGQTVVDFDYTYRATQPNVEVGVGIDRERFVAILDEAFAPEP